MTDENNPFKIALKNISHLKESITLFSCLLKLKELNKESYFYTGEVKTSFLYSFLVKKYTDYYTDEVDFISFFNLCKKTNCTYMDLNHLLNNFQIVDEENENKNIYLREKVLKNHYHSCSFKKAVLSIIDKKLLKKDSNFDSIIISFAKNNEVSILQYLIDEKVITVNDFFKEESYEAPLFFYINSYSGFQKLWNQNPTINLSLLSKKVIKSNEYTNNSMQIKYTNFLQKLVALSNRSISNNESKKIKDCFENFKKTYDEIKTKMNFTNQENVEQSFSNLMNYAVENNAKIAMFLIKNKEYKKYLSSKKEYLFTLMNTSFNNGLYELIEYIFKSKINQLFNLIPEEKILLKILTKPEKIKKYGKRQIKFITLLLNNCIENKLLNSEITHELFTNFFNNHSQNLSLKIKKNEFNQYKVDMSFECTYRAREENILELLIYAINEKNLSLTQQYESLNMQTYLEKLFYDALNNNDLINEFFLLGNEKQLHYKGFKNLSNQLKIDFFNNISDNMYLSNFTEKYLKEDIHFDKNKIIMVNNYQSIKRFTFSLHKMLDGFDLSVFPVNFFDKKATIYLQESLRNYINTINNQDVYKTIISLESNIEKNKLENNLKNSFLKQSIKKNKI
jgi:hypothetical protein